MATADASKNKVHSRRTQLQTVDQKRVKDNALTRVQTALELDAFQDHFGELA